MKDMKADTIARIFVNEIISRHGAPSRLLSDQGKNFLSNLVKGVCVFFKTEKIQTTAWNPKCDGLVERFNKTLSQMLAAYSDANQTSWDIYLNLVLFAYRTSKQDSTEKTPFELLYGRTARLGDLDNYNLGYETSEFVKDLHESWLEAKENIIKHAEVYRKNYDSKLKNTQDKPIVYQEGEFVRVKQPLTKVGLKRKLRSDHWSEPREVSKVLSKQNIEIILPNGNKKVINVNNAKKKEKPRAWNEFIKSTPTVTNSGRISIPRYQNQTHEDEMEEPIHIITLKKREERMWNRT
jgi:hypothetical protein